MVEELLAARSIDVTYKTVRRWALKFGQKIAKNIRHRPAALGDKWHLDEVVVNINAHHWWLWRAVDQHSAALDALVQSGRNRQATERLIENSHQPTRIREKVMRRFKSACHLQRFVSVHDQVANIFQHRRYNREAKAKRAARTQAMQTCGMVSCAQRMENAAV